MLTLVEFCNSNKLKGTEDVFQSLEENYDIDVVDYPCTNNCGICSKGYFAIVDGELVGAKDPEQLLENIYKRIDKINKEFEEIFGSEDLS